LKTLLMKALTLALSLVVAFLLAACGSAGSGQQGDDSGGGGHRQMDHGQMDHGSMGMGSGGMAKQMVMENGKYSDKAFIDAMVPHHQGAIAMAEVALKNAEHQEIIQLSRNIISSQQAEIEELKSIKQEEFGTSNVPMEMSPEQMRGMGMMMDPQQLANQKPFDEAFIDAMIPHHQSAIEMAAVANEKSKNPRIKELAQNITSAQKREIEQMKGWRREWYPEG
jgi:predicted outer membrane protein